MMAMVLAIILIRGKRTYTNTARLFLDSRDKSSISRCFNNSVFPGFLMQEHLYERLSKEALGIPGTKKTVYMLIDSTAQSKRSKKMGNRIIHTKGYISNHFFVMGLLYFPDTNVRIPLPRRVYRTKRYCQKHGYKYRSQVQLAEMMIRYAHVPDDIDVIVIFDSYFPSKGVIKAIKNKGYHFVCSAKKNRVDVDTGKQLKAICQEHIVSGRLKNRIQIRVPSKRSGYAHVSAQKYETKIYITYTEKLNISKMGDVQVVFSRKESDKSDLKNMRYILTDMLHINTCEILTIYSYRWQIELYFKELKSYLGLGHYQMLSFRAIVRHVDCVIMAFMYLEHLRIKKLMEHPNQRQWKYARTLQMSYVLAHEVRITNLWYLKRKVKDESSFAKLEQELREKLPLVA
jgi:SRSO17 transposase